MPPPLNAFKNSNEFGSNKNRTLVRSRSAATTSAIEACTTGGMTPIQIQIDISRSNYAIAAVIQRLYPQAFQDPFGQSTDSAGRTIDNQVIIAAFQQAGGKAAEAANKVAEFCYPKFSRIHHVGDVPTTLTSQKVVVTLNIGGETGPKPFAGATIDNSGDIGGERSEL